MYTFQLKDVIAPAQHDVQFFALMVGNLPHEIAFRGPHAKALVKVMNKWVTNCRWTCDWSHNATVDD